MTFEEGLPGRIQNKSTVAGSEIKDSMLGTSDFKKGEGEDDIAEEGATNLQPIMINGRTYYLGASEERDRELLEVQDIARKESG